MADLSAIGGGIQIPVQVNVQESGRKISDVYRELDQTKTASEKLARALKEAFKFDNANLRSFTDLANAIKNISQQVRTASDNITSFGRGSQSIERLKSDMVALQQAMARTASGAKMSNTELAKSYIEVGKAVDAVTRSLTSARTGTGGPGGVSNFLIGSSNLKAYTKDLNDLKAVYGELGKTLASGKWSNASGSIASGGGATGSMAWLKKPLQEVEDQFKKTKASAETFWGTLGGKIGNVVVYAGMYKLIGAVVDLGAQFVITAAKMEQLRASYNGVFGAQSGAQFEYVTQTANKYGKAIDDVSASYLKFAASTDYMGMSADTTKRIFEATTQAITKVGGSSEDVKGTLMAMQQMLSKGTVMSEEFRLQFAERIPGAMKMGADALGVTAAEFKKMMEEGKVVASDFLPKLVEQMEKFAVGWEKSADTLTANWTRLGNAFKQFMGDQSTGLTQSLNATVKWAANSVDAVNSFLKNKDTRDRYTWYLMKGVEGFEGGKSVKDMRDQLKFFESQSDKAQVAELSRVLDARRKASFGFTSLMDGDLENLINTKQRGIDQEDFVAKAKEFIESTIKAGNVSQENADKVIWFKSAIESITKQPYEIRLGVDLSGIDNAMNAINSLFKHTKEYAAEQAELSLTQTNARLEENKAKLEQMRSGSPDMLLRGDILKTMEAIRKDEANQKMLEDKAFDARRNVALNTPTRRQLKQLQDAVGSNATKRQKVDMVNMNLVSAWEYANSMERQGVWTSEQSAAYNAEALKAHRQGLDDIAKSGAGAANAVGDLTAKTEAFAYQAMKFNAEARGDSLTSGLMDIEAWAVEQQNKINKLGKRADAMGMGQKEFDSLKQAKFLNEYTKEYEKQNKALAAQLSILGDIESSPALKMQAENMKLEMEYGDRAQKQLQDSIAAHEEKYATLGDGQTKEKELLALIIEDEKKRLALLPELLTKKQEELKIQRQIQELEDKATYAAMMGDPRAALSAQIELKKKQLDTLSKEEGNLYKIKILMEEIDRLYAKRDMNVGKLIDVEMADYANKVYDDLTNKISTAIPQALDQFGDAISGNLTDLISGAKTAEQAWADMGKIMQQAILRIIIDIGVLIAKMQVLRWLGYGTGASLNGVGINTAGGAASGVAGQTSAASGLGLDDVSKYASYGDKVSSFLSPTASSGPGYWTPGMSTSPAPTTVSGSVPGASLGASVGAGLASGGIGYMAGGYIRPDNPSASYVGAGVGALAGGLASYTGVGATVGAALGISAGLASTGIGALVAIPAALLTGALTPNTVKTSKTGDKGITINMMTAGNTGIMGYEGYRQTSSGLFGSSSTKHFKGYTTADPELTKAWNEGMLKVGNTLESTLKTLTIGIEPLKTFSFPIMFDVNSENMEKALYNISNAMAENAITAAGLKDEFDSVAKEGEMYIDQLKRLSESYSSLKLSAEVAGASLELMSGSISKIQQAAYASDLIDRLGGADAVNQMYDRIARHSGQTLEERANSAMMVYGRQAGESLAYLGDSSVNASNFWSKYAAARPGMSVDDAKKWSDAAAAMDAFEQSYFSAEQVRLSMLQDEISVLEESAAALENTVGIWQRVVDAIKAALEDIRFDPGLTSLTPLEVYNEKRSKFLGLADRAKNGDTAAMEELASFSRDFLEESRSYYGASETYFSDFTLVSDTLSSTQTIAEMQLSTARAQLDALNIQISLHQTEIARLEALQQGIGAGMDAILAKMGESGAASAAIQAANAAQAATAATIAYVAPASSGGDMSAFFSAFNQPQTPALPDWLQNSYDPDRRAGGGAFSAGEWSWVGEYGPELVRFHSPGQVYRNQDSVLDTTPINTGLQRVAQATAAGAMATKEEVAAMRREMARMSKALQRVASKA